MLLITQRSYLDDIIGSRSLRAIDNLEAYPGPFFKGLEAFSFDGGVMDEHILSAILLDKAKTFRVIKPLYSTFSHATTPFELSPEWDRMMFPGFGRPDFSLSRLWLHHRKLSRKRCRLCFVDISTNPRNTTATFKAIIY